VTHRFSHAGLRTRALLFGSLLLVAPLGSAEAAAAQGERARSAAVVKPTKLAEAEAAATSSLTKSEAEEEQTCNRPRRRLWVEGEGWVVRRISACH
jgi:hypothetical protein